MLERTFALFDMDHNGTVSKGELRKRLQQLLRRRDTLSEEEASYLMRVAFDIGNNNNNSDDDDKEELSLQDFCKGLQQDEETEFDGADEELLTVFEQLDVNGDGYLTKKELRDGLEGRLGMALGMSEEEWASLKFDDETPIDFEQFKVILLTL